MNEGHLTSIALFVRRPVFAFVLNALIMIAGLAAYFAVDVRELPDVDRPVISVVTDFKNAAAQTVDREVTRKVEKALSRIAGIKTISSRSSYGRSRVVMEFNNGVDLNAAASDIRDVVSRLVRTLPSEATAPTIIKADSNASSIMLLAVTSDSTPIEDNLKKSWDTDRVQRSACLAGEFAFSAPSNQVLSFEHDIPKHYPNTHRLQRMNTNLVTHFPPG